MQSNTGNRQANEAEFALQGPVPLSPASFKPLSSVISKGGLKKATGTARTATDMGNICQQGPHYPWRVASDFSSCAFSDAFLPKLHW